MPGTNGSALLIALQDWLHFEKITKSLFFVKYTERCDKVIFSVFRNFNIGMRFVLLAHNMPFPAASS